MASCGCSRELAMMDIAEVLHATGIPYAFRLLRLVREKGFPAPAQAPDGTPLVWSRAAVEAWLVERATSPEALAALQ